MGAGLHISASIDAGENVKILNSYFSTEAESYSDPSGNYVVEVKDFNRNLLSSTRFSSTTNFDGGDEFLSLRVPVNSNAFFVDIYRDGMGRRDGVATVVIPSDVISEEIKFIPDQAFKEKPFESRQQLKNLVARLRASLIDLDINMARSLLSGEIIPKFNLLLEDDFERSTIIDADKGVLSTVSSGALLRLIAAQVENPVPANPFISLSLLNTEGVGGRSIVGINPLRKPEISDKKFVYDCYFDSQKVRTKRGPRKFSAESLLLSPGEHRWSVQTFLVDAKFDEAAEKAIFEAELLTDRLEVELGLETDPQKKDKISRKIAENERKIRLLQIQRDKDRLALGSPAELKFEVFEK